MHKAVTLPMNLWRVVRKAMETSTIKAALDGKQADKAILEVTLRMVDEQLGINHGSNSACVAEQRVR